MESVRTVFLQMLKEMRGIPSNGDSNVAEAIDRCIDIVIKYAPESDEVRSLAPDAVIAECIVRVGYGTSHYDSETGDCTHDNYASIEEVISGNWSHYDTSMSEALAHDFNLPFNFERYRLTVTADGTRSYKKEKK